MKDKVDCSVDQSNGVPEHIAGLDALVEKAAGNNMRAVVPQ